MTNTALQITNFDFYGDKLIALQDNATGEIYTAINSVLNRTQSDHRWLLLNLQNCFTLDAIEHNKDIRKLFEKMVDYLLEKYNLISTEEPVKCKTIFDK